MIFCEYTSPIPGSELRSALLAELISIWWAAIVVEAIDPPWALAVLCAAVETVSAPRASMDAITAGAAIFLKQFVIFIPLAAF
jgi:hypothetical protein